jgi:GTPase Era involved in 16S rRNA processing
MRMILLITTTSMPVSMIRLEKAKYLMSDVPGYHSREPKGWNRLMNSRANSAVNRIIVMLFFFSYKYPGMGRFIAKWVE